MSVRIPTPRPHLIRIKRCKTHETYFDAEDGEFKTREVDFFDIRTYGFNQYNGKKKLRHSAIGRTLQDAIGWQRQWRWRCFSGEMPDEKVLKKLRAGRS